MISSLNAVRHGLTSETSVLPTEDSERYEELRDGLTRDLAPQGAVEEQLVKEIVDLSWRLRRASNVEHGVLAGGVAAADERFFRDRQRKFEVREVDVMFARMRSPDDLLEVVDEEMHAHLEMLAAEAEDVRRSDEVRLASAFIEDAAGPGALGRLSRYEAGLFRRRNQALDKLEKLQAQRSESSAEVSE